MVRLFLVRCSIHVPFLTTSSSSSLVHTIRTAADKSGRMSDAQGQSCIYIYISSFDCRRTFRKEGIFSGNTMAIKSPAGEADRRRAAGPPGVAPELLIISHPRHRPANIRCHPITGATLRPPIRRHHRIRHICILREDLS